MKNSLTKIALATMIIVAPLAAEENNSEYTYNTHSLFAIEGGISDITTEKSGSDMEKNELASAGLKIGAQSDNYRAFLSARYYDVSDFSHMNMYGGELQYLFNFSNFANFFIGANGGVADIQIKAQNGLDSEKVSSMYYGGDTGFNFHAGDAVDIEIGARYMSIQDGEIIQGPNAYDVSSVVTAYASLIFRWKMD